MAFQRNVGTHYKSDTASHTGRVVEIWRFTGSQFKTKRLRGKGSSKGMTSNECCMHFSTFYTMGCLCSRSYWEICQGHWAEYTVQNTPCRMSLTVICFSLIALRLERQQTYLSENNLQASIHKMSNTTLEVFH